MLRFLHINQVIDFRCLGFFESAFEDFGLSVMSRLLVRPAAVS